MAGQSVHDPIFFGRRHELYPATANTIIANPTRLNVPISIATCTLLPPVLLIAERSTLAPTETF
jgi:hypothetical protein